MGLLRTTTQLAAGDDGTATWGNKVYNDIGSIVNYRLVTTDTYGSTTTFDMNTSGIHLVTLTGNPTLDVTNVTDGQTFVIILKQDGTGSHTVTWWTGILWPSGTAPTLTTTGNKYDIFAFIKIGSSYLASFIAFNV